MTTFHITTLGCPKNAVDSDKVEASLLADGLVPSDAPEDADVVVLNTCAFIEAAREESISTALELAQRRHPNAKLVVTGCMAERYGSELAEALPEADAVIGFGDEGSIATVVLKQKPTGIRDLLDLPRAPQASPWAYVKVAEGCDRACAFCAIPSFRGKQRSRIPEAIVAEARGLVAEGVREIVLVAQDLAWYGRDIGQHGALAPLLHELDELREDGLARIRLLYLYPSEVKEPLISTMLELESVVPYFDLSLQHASPLHLRRMKRWGSGERFLEMIEKIRAQEPNATFRSSFIVGFPGETEQDHEQLLQFLETAQLDWAGFFAFSKEDGTAAFDMQNQISSELTQERLQECSDTQEPITTRARDDLVGHEIDVLIDGLDDGTAFGRTYREAPEIDGLVHIDEKAVPGSIVRARVLESLGTDLRAVTLTNASPVE